MTIREAYENLMKRQHTSTRNTVMGMGVIVVNFVLNRSKHVIFHKQTEN